MKKIAFISITLLLLVMLMELFSWLFFRAITGHDYNQVETRRNNRIAEIMEEMKVENSNRGQKPTSIHPYFGYQDTTLNQEAFDNCTDSTFNVAVLGGSVAGAFSWHIVHDSLNPFIRELEKFSDGKPVRIIEMCRGGYKQPQPLFELQYFLLNSKKIDLVLNIDGYNELVMAVQNIRSNVNPVNPSFFHMEYLNNQLNNSFTQHELDLMMEVRQREKGELSKLKLADQTLLGYSVTFNAYTTLISERNRKISLEMNQEMQKEMSGNPSREVQGPGFNCVGSELECAIEIWEKASVMIHNTCKVNSIPYYHFLQPNQYLEGSKKLTPQEMDIAFQPDSEWSKIASAGYPILVERGEALKKQLNFVDLTKIFQEESESIYTDNCCHFEEVGNRVMAREILKAIKIKQHELG